MTLRPPGVGEVVTKDGSHFSAVEVVENAVHRIDVLLPVGVGECQTISFVVSNIERNVQGFAIAFSGQATGRCCGTIAASYRMTRSAVHAGLHDIVHHDAD